MDHCKPNIFLHGTRRKMADILERQHRIIDIHTRIYSHFKKSVCFHRECRAYKDSPNGKNSKLNDYGISFLKSIKIAFMDMQTQSAQGHQKVMEGMKHKETEKEILK